MRETNGEKKEKRLSDSVAEEIRSMITVEKRFLPGDKLPNENELAQELGISRTTLREAIRVLVTNGLVEIRRGKGTFVAMNITKANEMWGTLASAKMKAKDLYEMRLIFEPEAAYLAAIRATLRERKQILSLGKQVESKILSQQDRTNEERAFHKAIAKATHNEFMNQLMPLIYEAIDKGVVLSEKNAQALQDTLADHRMIMDFLATGNAQGAKSAMKIHILHAMQRLNLLLP